MAAKTNRRRPRANTQRNTQRRRPRASASHHRTRSRPRHNAAGRNRRGQFTSRRRSSGHRRRTNPYGYRRRRAYGRPNPSITRGGVMTIVTNSAYGAIGAIGSRMIPNFVLPMIGVANTSFVGYAANAASGWLLAVVGGKALGREAYKWILAGTGIGLALRIIQDFGLLGPLADKAAAATGMGDVGVLLPSSFVDPPLFTGNGAQRVIPAAWRQLPPTQQQVAAAAANGKRAGMGASTYKQSTY